MILGTLRKSGRRVRQKANTARKSLRKAANRPIVPYETIQRTGQRSRQTTSNQRDGQINPAATFLSDVIGERKPFMLWSFLSQQARLKMTV